ncbi:MAG TPA: SsrA-binding protein SmpB [Candidatus Omnitrophota bacterium]|nr:SsrA-binding protein SmpB [Candidatus Omnitrophota bacterium]HPS20515.1 SsrA-binding protein SmpB [Candidatus Omnitrophota bacterium]
MENNELVTTNKQVFRDYTVEKTYEAGIQLFGNEVKSLRSGSADLKGSFALIQKGEIFLYNMHISPYPFSREVLAPLRPRKLLMHRVEIAHLDTKVGRQGYSLIPIKVFFKRGYAKVELALAKGKKLHDKREAIKDKQVKRDIDQMSKRRR